MTRKRLAFGPMILLIGSLTLAPTFVTFGYEEVEVVSGGSIEGRVILEGGVPPARIFHLVFSPNIDYCQRISDGKGNRLLKEFIVSEDGGFQNAVVAVIGVQKGKPFTETPELVIENCEIQPFVSPVRNRHPISLVSRDPITHDLQAYSLREPDRPYAFQMFNKPMPEGTKSSKMVRFRKGHFIFRTQCGVHDFMQSWGIAVGNPYYAVTGSKGRYEIPDLPPGTYDVIAWHPRMNVQAKRITVLPRAMGILNFEFDASGIEIPLYDLQKGYRLETWLGLRELVTPSVELQVHDP